MSNMSYCRFENTVQDMQDCINALDEGLNDLEAMMRSASSWQEAHAMKRFIELCREVAETYEEDEDAIEESET